MFLQVTVCYVSILKSLTKYIISLTDVYQYASNQFWILFCLSKMIEKKLDNFNEKQGLCQQKIKPILLKWTDIVIDESQFIADLKAKTFLKSYNFCRSSAQRLWKKPVIGSPCNCRTLKLFFRIEEEIFEFLKSIFKLC